MKSVKILLAGLVPLLMLSCQTYDKDGQQNPEDRITVNYSVLNSTITSYSTVEAINGEDQMASLHILFFESSSDGSGKFIEHYDASPESGQPLGSWGTFKIDLPIGTKVSATEEYVLLLLANVENYFEGVTVDQWVVSLENKTQMEVTGSFARLIDPESLTDNYTGRVYSNLLPMSATVNKPADETNVTARLVRAVARLDVENKASGYKLVSASVWNAFPRTTVWNTAFNDFSGPRITRLYGITGVDNLIEGQLYSFENYVVSPEQNDELSTCLILGLEDDLTKVVTFYRANVNARNMGQTLKRNNVYRITINNVYGGGAPTEKDAYKDSELHLDYKINGWDVDQQGNIQFDGDNILAIPTTNVYFTPLGGELEMNIFTFGEGYLVMTKEMLPPGITSSLNGNLLTIYAEPSEDTKEGLIEVKFGNLIGTINIYQTGDQSEYLDLSISTVETFPNEAGATMAGYVGVSSSGSWTAEIYNDGFAFVANNSRYLSGDDGGTFSLKTVSTNDNPGARYAFVLVTLDSNVEVSRVLVLAQSGEGGVQVNPNVGTLVFSADGSPVTQNTFTVVTDDGEPWEIVKSGANSSAFDIQQSGSGFTVTASLNTEMYDLEANIRVRLVSDQTLYFDLPVKQNSHSLSLDPATVATMASQGGTTAEITVTSSAPWEATITSENTSATFTSGGTTISNGQNGDKFRVVIPEASVPAVFPKVTVTVKITGTNIERQLIVLQERMATRSLHVVSYSNYFGQLTNTDNDYYRNYIRAFGDAMRNSNLFGLNGTVYTEPYTNFSTNNTPDNNTDIFVITVVAPSSDRMKTIYNWLTDDPKRVLLLWADVDAVSNFNYLKSAGLSSEYAAVVHNSPSINTARTINPDNNYTVNNNALMDYLLRSGPFTNGTEIAKSNIQIHSFDTYACYLTSWPDHFIPIIMHPENNSRCLFGIDVKNRLIFNGNVDIFSGAGGSGYNSSRDYSGGTYSEYNYKFLCNVIAWFTNAAQYGEEFTAQFQVN